MSDGPTPEQRDDYHRDLARRPSICEHCGTPSAAMLALNVRYADSGCDCGCHALVRHERVWYPRHASAR